MPAAYQGGALAVRRAMMVSAMTPILVHARCGKSRPGECVLPVSGRSTHGRSSHMSAATELALLCLVAAAAGGVALAANDLAFTVIFAALSWIALGHVLRDN